MIVWTLLDPSQVVNTEQYVSQSVPPYYIVREHCLPQHFEVWLVLRVDYLAILMITMVVLAVLTRKLSEKSLKIARKSIYLLLL